MHSLMRIAAIVMLALIPAACGGGFLSFGGGGHDSGDGCNGDGSIVLDPGYYHLVVGGDDGEGSATENSTNGGGSLTERDNCSGIARIDFSNDGRGAAGIGVTPLKSGACTMVISDGPNCVDSSITVAPAPSSSTIRRGASPAV